MVMVQILVLRVHRKLNHHSLAEGIPTTRHHRRCRPSLPRPVQCPHQTHPIIIILTHLTNTSLVLLNRLLRVNHHHLKLLTERIIPL